MDKAQLLATIKQICTEKSIPLEAVHSTIEAALAAAYRKDFGQKGQNIKVNFNLETGESEIFEVKEIVEDLPEELQAQIETQEIIEIPPKEKEEGEKAEGEEEEGERRFNPKTQIQISDALKIDPKYKVGDEIWKSLDVPSGYGRMAAQTAKQVIIQKLREAERGVLFEEFKGKEGALLTGMVQRREPARVLIDLGNITAVIPIEHQIPGERYNSGERIKVYVVAVEQTTKGPEVIVSRSHEKLIAKLFEMEIPEIASGLVKIKALAREAGSRSKIAVFTEDESVDAIGSCVGQKGSRIQTIINELGGEKIDIIEWNANPEVFLTNALSPAKVSRIDLDEDTKSAKIFVASDQLSLAIGKAGQNVRLAVKLTGWNLNIQEFTAEEKTKNSKKTKKEADADEKENAAEEKEVKEDKKKPKKKTKKENKEE